MDSDLNHAFLGVYSSSKEILKNKQRHLYCSMLDLLMNTCKTTYNAGSKVTIDDLVKFWLSDVLPLMFDEDFAIQSSAFTALNQGLKTLDISVIHTCSHWLQLKNTIITYIPCIHKLRENQNKYWHRIWCVLIRLLDREILKGASTINSFLSIVELGFRSSENTVRAEAFLCWRSLIQIFSIYNELSSPKRLKLICIPLKSSQSKSPQIAAIKLRVWWYLLTCFRENIGQYFETLVESFLHFTFGSTSRNVSSVAQQFVSVRELAIPCLGTLLSTEHNDFLERLLYEYQLEPFCQPSPLMVLPLLQKNWRSLVNAGIDAIRILIYADSIISESEQHLLHLLLRLLLNLMIRFDFAPCFTCICSELADMTPINPRPVVFSLNIIAAEGLMLNRSLDDMENFSGILSALTHLMISAKSFTPPAILKSCVDRVFSLDAFCNSRNQRRVLSTVLNLILQSHEVTIETFETKLLIWLRVSHYILKFLKERSVNDFANELNQWILWPLQLKCAFDGMYTNSSFDTEFCVVWKQLLNLGENYHERSNFLNDLKQVLHKMLTACREIPYFADFFGAYVAAVLKLKVVEQSKHHSELFGFMHAILEHPFSQKTLEACLNSFRNLVVSLREHEICMHFEVLKSTLLAVIQTAAKGSIEQTFFEEWKRRILEKLRVHPNRNLAIQFRELFKVNDVFVIIPSVWSLNPDKLTERQKERFSEKADIPALYNDISQSQEEPIKPWTPRKVVIVNENKTEIAIENVNDRTEFRNKPSSTVNNKKQNFFSDNVVDLSNIIKNTVNLNLPLVSIPIEKEKASIPKTRTSKRNSFHERLLREKQDKKSCNEVSIYQRSCAYSY